MTYLFPPTDSLPPRTTEIIIDSFAGGGGASTGIFLALGRHPDVAVNHDPEAVAMHTVNHPTTEHFCQNVWQVNPGDVAARGPIGLAWFSPDCKHFSKAKGGKPVEKRIRDLAWVVVAYAKLPRHLRPRVIILENVEEFVTWGPLGDDGRPCPERKGDEFVRWTSELRRLGYRIEWRELRACDYGAPTIRKRFFLVARCDGEPIVWPEPSHGAPDSPEVLAGKRLPWRTAAQIIDWSIPCPSIFLTKEEAKVLRIKRPLEEATLRRIFNGLKRYVIDHPRPFVVPVTHAGDDRCHDSREPLRTITTAKRGEMSVIMPYMAGCGGRAAQSPERGADKSLWTMTAKADQILCAPFITKFRNGSTGHRADEPLHTITTAHSEYHPGGAAPLGVVMPFVSRQFGASVGHEADQPLGTITAGGGKSAVVMPYLMTNTTGHSGAEIVGQVPTITTGQQQYLITPYLQTYYGPKRVDEVRGCPADGLLGTQTTENRHAVVMPYLASTANSKTTGRGKYHWNPGEPLRTITSAPSFAVVSPFLVKPNHTGPGYNAFRGQNPCAPVQTITAAPGFAVIAPTMVQTGYGERQGQAPRSLDMKKPLGTVVAGGQKHALIASWIVQHNTGAVGHEMGAPVSTIMHSGSHQMLAATYLTNFYTSNTGGGEGDIERPLKTVTAGGWHQAEVRAFMVKYYGTAEDGQDCREPLHTATAKARFGLVTVEGQEWAIVDIGMRMLSPRELFRAQGFPDDYVIDLTFNGRPLPKSSQVRMCGNSVCPPIAAALVGANVPELARKMEAAQ